MFKQRLWLLLGLVIAVLVALGAWFITRNPIPPPTTTAAEFASLPEGGAVSLVGQIVAMADDDLTVELLTGAQFDQRTDLYLHINIATVTNVQRGGWPAVAPEALVQFVGVKTGPDSVRAERLVIYTGFVTGPP